MILEIVQRDTPLRRTASTNGGEYHGPCVSCGGRDRFTLWPHEGPTGRFWCRQCGISGTGIDYLHKLKGLSVKEACAELNYTPKGNNVRDILNKNTNIAWLNPPQQRIPKEVFRHEIKLLTLPHEAPVTETVIQNAPIEHDIVSDDPETEGLPELVTVSDTMNVRPRASYTHPLDTRDIEKFGCTGCDHLHELTCNGWGYARLIGLMDTCPKGRVTARLTTESQALVVM